MNGRVCVIVRREGERCLLQRRSVERERVCVREGVFPSERGHVCVSGCGFVREGVFALELEGAPQMTEESGVVAFENRRVVAAGMVAVAAQLSRTQPTTHRDRRGYTEPWG